MSITANDLVGLINSQIERYDTISIELEVRSLMRNTRTFYVLHSCECLSVLAASCWGMQNWEIEGEKQLYERSMEIYQLIVNHPSGELAPTRKLPPLLDTSLRVVKHFEKLQLLKDHAIAFCLPCKAPLPKNLAGEIDGRLFIALPFNPNSNDRDGAAYHRLFNFAMDEALKAKAELLSIAITDRKIRPILQKFLKSDPYSRAFRAIHIYYPLWVDVKETRPPSPSLQEREME